MKVLLRRWLLSLTALIGLVLFLNPMNAVGQSGIGIETYGLTGLEGVECSNEVKVSQVNMTYGNFGDILECTSTSETSFTLYGGIGYLYYPSGNGATIDYNDDPSTWNTNLRMVSGNHLLAGGADYCIDYEGDDHDLGQTGFQVWVYWWDGLPNGKTKKYQIDIRECDPEGDDDNSLTDLMVSGLYHCIDGDMEQPVPVDNEGAWTVDLPDWASGTTELTLEWTIAGTATSTPESPLVHTFTMGDDDLVITVFAENGDQADYTLHVNWIDTDLSSDKMLTMFKFVMPDVNSIDVDYAGVINQDTKQVALEVPFGTDVEALVAFFTVSEGALMTHSEDTPQIMLSGLSPALDYTEPVAFTVHAEDCSTVEYFVTVNIADNCCNDIGSLTISSMFSDCYDDFDVEEDFVLGEDNDWTVTVPFGTDLEDFVLTLTPAVGSEGMIWTTLPTSFTDGVEETVTVTAENGISTQDFTLTVNVADASDEHLLIAFGFTLDEVDYDGVVDQETHRVDVVLPYGTDLNSLAACFEVSDYACFYINGPGATDFELQWDCVTENDFSAPRHFTVKAQDGSEDNYNVVVTLEDPSTDNSLTELEVSGTEDCLGFATDPTVTKDGDVYTIRLRTGMDEGKELDVAFVINDLATSNPTSPATVSFSADEEEYDIVVTAENEETATYTLVANFVEPSTNKAITMFSFEAYDDDEWTGNHQFNQTYLGTINETAKTVTVHVPDGTDVTALKASFILNDMYARMTHSEENSDEQVPQNSGMSALDYTTPVAFTVYDEACETVEYFVTVIIDDNEGNEIELLSLDGVENANCECGDMEDIEGEVVFEEMDITITVPYGTDMDNIELSGMLSEGATSEPALEDITSATTSIVVTAEDGLAVKTYTLTFVMADPLEGNDIMTFGFDKEFNPTLEMDEIWGTIDQTKRRIDVQVPYGTPVASLIASFTNSAMSCVYINGPEVTDQTNQCSDVTVNNFSTDLTYTVIAQNGDESYYNVYVEVLPADTQTALTHFMVMDLPECFGSFTYDVSGDMDGMDITIMVKEGTDMSAVMVDFDIPAKATVDPMPGVWDLSDPVEVTVTAQDGTTVAVYTVTAVEFDPSSDKKILSYKIGDATGTINQSDKMIEVWVPWLTDLDGLVANFTLSAGARMTHSEDSWVLQTSGVTPNDFTYPIAYTVWAEDCTTVEYFVIVHITPNTNTGISQFSIPYTGCGCDLGVKFDEYAKRIYVRIPYANADGSVVSLSSVTPAVIGVAAGATVSPKAGVAQNFASGAVSYTVTAPDGVTKQTWTVVVENPPCTGTDILDFAFEGDDQVGDAIIDDEAHQIIVTVKPGTDISAMVYDLTLDCGATICCNAGACSGQEIDFSGGDNCHICVVTAQDKSISQEWTICVREDDVTPPDAYTNSVLVHNCDESVDVWASESGTVYIIAASHVDNCTSIDDMDDIVDAHYGASADYPYADSVVSVSTNGLWAGKYYAFAVDSAGNISCASENGFYVDVCVIEVANLCDLRAGSEVYTYVVTGEVLVSYEEGNFKFVQDAGCGIKVVDQMGSWAAKYGEGQGLTNIKGTINKSGNEFVFTPVCCYSPVKSSSGNTIVPVMLTWDEFVANCYDHERGYESMLVKITDPMIAFDDYSSENPLWVLDYLDLATVNARGDYEYFIQKVFNADYIGTAIPTDPTVYQGIRTNVKWGSNLYGLITPRKKTDIIKVTGGILIADPNPANINGVLPGSCGSVTINIINQGVGNLTISAAYLNDAAGTDEFELMDPEQVPFVLGTWESQSFTVHFCPNDAGAESTTLLVEYGDGKTIEVPINGTTVLINPTPFCEDFNETGWNGNPDKNGWTHNGTPAGDVEGIVNVGWYNAHSRIGDSGFHLIIYPFNNQTVWAKSPGFVINDASKYLTFYQGALDGFNNGWGTSAMSKDPRKVWISDDNQQTWKEIYATTGDKLPEVVAAVYEPHQKVEVSLADYAGKTVFFKFQSYRTGANRGYWIVENICIADLITEPIFDAPGLVDFGGVQVGETGTASVTITNKGASVLKIKKVELMAGPQFGITDDNTYPVEITSGSEAYALNGQESVVFDLSFSPDDIGIFTGKVLVTYGMYSDMLAEVALTGEGLSCATAAEAFVGENWAASQNSWFTYTAEKFQIVNINSCHPNNTTDPYVYSYDTWLDVYDECDGTVIATNDDLEWDICPYNRASSGVTIAMNEGETVKIFWPWAFSSEGDDQGFYFNIVPSYPVDGDVCETAIPLTLPVVNHFGSTVAFADDYDISPCSPFSNYMDGNDKVYSITLEYEGYLTGSILGAYGSIHVLDKCPVEELEKRNCLAFASGPNGGSFEKRIQPGFYYVIVSTWAPPQTVDYLLNMSFRGLGVENDQLTSSLKVYPNPTSGMFTVNISNAEVSDLTLELVNISGQVVYRNEVKSVYNYNEEIDASAFAKGVYYVKVNDGKEVKIEKVVIQ